MQLTMRVTEQARNKRRIRELGGRVLYASTPCVISPSRASGICGIGKWVMFGTLSATAICKAAATGIRGMGSSLSAIWNTSTGRGGKRETEVSGSSNDAAAAADSRTDRRDSCSGGSHKHSSHQNGASNVTVRYVYDTCVVVDCSQWSDVMSECTKARFPGVDIRITHSPTSLSGFCVVLKLPYHATSLDDPHPKSQVSRSKKQLQDGNSRGEKRDGSSHSLILRIVHRCAAAVADLVMSPARIEKKWAHLAGAVLLCGMLHLTYCAVNAMASGK